MTAESCACCAALPLFWFSSISSGMIRAKSSNRSLADGVRHSFSYYCHAESIQNTQDHRPPWASPSRADQGDSPQIKAGKFQVEAKVSQLPLSLMRLPWTIMPPETVHPHYNHESYTNSLISIPAGNSNGIQPNARLDIGACGVTPTSPRRPLSFIRKRQRSKSIAPFSCMLGSKLGI